MTGTLRISWACVLAAAWLAARAASAAEQTLSFDPASARIHFTLGATLHTAKGSVELERGMLRFDASGGRVSGEIVIDALSAETGNGSRDRNMHRDVLESERFPKIVFRPERLELLRRDASSADVRLHGTLDMHGTQRPLALPARLEARGERIAIAASFRVPYVDWGMRDYSNFVLRVDRHVDVQLEVEGTLAAP